MAIPLGLGLFICTTQATMGHALLYTGIGHVALLSCCRLGDRRLLLACEPPADQSMMRRTSRLCDPGTLRRRRILLRAVAAAVEERPHTAARRATGSRFVPARPRRISARNQGSHARSAYGALAIVCRGRMVHDDAHEVLHANHRGCVLRCALSVAAMEVLPLQLVLADSRCLRSSRSSAPTRRSSASTKRLKRGRRRFKKPYRSFWI